MSEPAGDNSVRSQDQLASHSAAAPVVLILGMHRSGTSLLARVANLCGVPMDREDKLMKPSHDNRRGYWEPEYIAKLNDDILDAYGGSWCAPPIGALPAGRLESELTERIEACVAPWLKTGRSWLWKDPRLTVTLPAWLASLPSPVGLISLRNPMDIWLSLYRRNRFPRASCYLLWEEYMRAALRHTEGLPRMCVRYEDFVDGPQVTVDAVVGFLESAGLVFERAPSLNPAYGECVGNLQHHRHSTEDFFEDEAATASQKQLYRALLAAVPNDLPAVPEKMTTSAGDVHEHFRRLQQRDEDAQLARLEEERFHVLDTKLSNEVHLAGERFTVIDGKLGEERNLAKERHECVTQSLADLRRATDDLRRTTEERFEVLNDTLAELIRAVGDLRQKRAYGEVRLRGLSLGLYRDAPRAAESPDTAPGDTSNPANVGRESSD